MDKSWQKWRMSSSKDEKTEKSEKTEKLGLGLDKALYVGISLAPFVLSTGTKGTPLVPVGVTNRD